MVDQNKIADDLGKLTAERDDLAERLARVEAERDELRDERWSVVATRNAALQRAERAEAAIAAVRELHRPFRIFDECDHEHELTEAGELPEGVYEIEEVGLTCMDGYMYSICYECCTSGSGYQTEECIDHDHGPDLVHCTTIRVLDAAPTAAGEERADG